MQQNREEIVKRLNIEPFMLITTSDKDVWEGIKFDYNDMHEVLWKSLEDFYGYPIKTDSDFERALELVPPSVQQNYPDIKTAVIMNYVNCIYSD